MITGDKPLTAAHVAKDVEIVDRDALILELKEMDAVLNDNIVHLTREQVESNLRFAGFLVFHCPLKEDAVPWRRSKVWLTHHIG